jgi:hypothetical protein
MNGLLDLSNYRHGEWHMRGQGLTLVIYSAPEIKLITFFNQWSEVLSLRFLGYLIISTCSKTRLADFNTYDTLTTKPSTQLTKQCLKSSEVCLIKDLLPPNLTSSLQNEHISLVNKERFPKKHLGLLCAT